MGCYLDQFKTAPDTFPVMGEISHDYLYSAEAAERIYNTFPNMKLLTFLRNPIQRSFSHYLFLHRSGMTRLSFRDAINDHPDIVDHSLYGKHLEQYLDLFPAEQLGIFNFHDLNVNNDLTLHVCQFLGIDAPNFDTHRKILGAAKPRNYFLAKLIKAGARTFRGVGLEKIVGTLKSNALVTQALYKEYQDHDKPKMKKDDQQFLREMFQDDLARLADRMHAANIPDPKWVRDLTNYP